MNSCCQVANFEAKSHEWKTRLENVFIQGQRLFCYVEEFCNLILAEAK